MDQEGQLQEIDAAALSLPVRRALGSTTAVVEGWQVTPLGGGIATPLGGGGLHRVTGTARDGDTRRSWSLVTKVLRPPTTVGTVFGQPDPGAMFYWKREAHLYGSGLLDGLPAGFAATLCYGIDERVDGVRLWLEDVAEPAGTRWSLARYGEAARHLGRFNGASLAGRPLPQAPWLCRDRLRWRAPVVAPFWDDFAARRDDPRVRHGWPGEVGARTERVWTERDRFLAALDTLPRVLCHGDADRRNLFGRDGVASETATVAIDWGCTGSGAVGTDLATLVAQSVLWARDREPAELPALARHCADGYVAGLREAGWAGEDRAVRLGYALSVALQFAAFAGAIVVALAGEAERPQVEAAFGATLEGILDRHAAAQPFVLDLADEARSLLASR